MHLNSAKTKKAHCFGALSQFAMKRFASIIPHGDDLTLRRQQLSARALIRRKHHFDFTVIRDRQLSTQFTRTIARITKLRVRLNRFNLAIRKHLEQEIRHGSIPEAHFLNKRSDPKERTTIPDLIAQV
jgi:hypothetical protein